MQVLLATSYLPNIQYFTKLVKYENVIIEQHENFPKQTFRNRCSIASTNGKLDLSIPVIAARTHKTYISEVLIDYSENWTRKHTHAITSAYRNAPFFEHYSEEILQAISCGKTNLLEFNQNILAILMELIGFERKISLSSEFTDLNKPNDYRYSIHPKAQYNKPDSNFKPVKYYQVFELNHEFFSNLSIIDLLFNEGPLAYSILKNCIVEKEDS